MYEGNLAMSGRPCVRRSLHEVRSAASKLYWLSTDFVQLSCLRFASSHHRQLCLLSTSPPTNTGEETRFVIMVLPHALHAANLMEETDINDPCPCPEYWTPWRNSHNPSNILEGGLNLLMSFPCSLTHRPAPILLEYNNLFAHRRSPWVLQRFNSSSSASDRLPSARPGMIADSQVIAYHSQDPQTK